MIIATPLSNGEKIEESIKSLLEGGWQYLREGESNEKNSSLEESSAERVCKMVKVAVQFAAMLYKEKLIAPDPDAPFDFKNLCWFISQPNRENLNLLLVFLSFFPKQNLRNASEGKQYLIEAYKRIQQGIKGRKKKGALLIEAVQKGPLSWEHMREILRAESHPPKTLGEKVPREDFSSLINQLIQTIAPLVKGGTLPRGIATWKNLQELLNTDPQASELIRQLIKAIEKKDDQQRGLLWKGLSEKIDEGSSSAQGLKTADKIGPAATSPWKQVAIGLGISHLFLTGIFIYLFLTKYLEMKQLVAQLLEMLKDLGD